MRATLNIPDELISEVQKISGEKSKAMAIIIAIEGFIREKKLKKLLSLKGKLEIDFDWKKERGRRNQGAENTY